MFDIEAIRRASPPREVVQDLLGINLPDKQVVTLNCPFHNDSTPSLRIDLDKGLYHCHGCHVGGDIFNLVMQVLGLDFYSSARWLARRAGLDEGKKPDLVDLLSRAQAVFARGKGFIASWAYSRGIEEASIDYWGLGYCQGLPWASDGSAWVGTGLMSKRGYFMLGRRATFPLLSSSGDPLSFSGRALHGEMPKYIHGSDHAYFTKGAYLYGLAQNRKAITASKSALLVEGPIDVIRLWQAGITNAVGVLGAFLTPRQCQVLRGLGVTSLYLGLDSDPAGRSAVERILLSSALSGGFEIRVVDWKPSKDPGDLNPEQALEAIANSSSTSRLLPLLEGSPREVAERWADRIKSAPPLDPLAHQVLEMISEKFKVPPQEVLAYVEGKGERKSHSNPESPRQEYSDQIQKIAAATLARGDKSLLTAASDLAALDPGGYLAQYFAGKYVPEAAPAAPEEITPHLHRLALECEYRIALAEGDLESLRTVRAAFIAQQISGRYNSVPAESVPALASGA